MRIALIGYGKMGRMIDSLALPLGFTVVARIDQTTDPGWADLDEAEVAIEFSGPAWAPDNLLRLAERSLPTVCGTTGWEAQYPTVAEAYRRQGCRLVTGTNFSVGVNLLFLLNRKLAGWMNQLPNYDVALEERHHTQKADAPSGTALTLAHEILQRLERKTQLAPPSELAYRPPAPEELTVGVVRVGGLAGTHRVLYTSSIDQLELVHTAHTREGFAQGALLAAKWLRANPGIHRFEDIFEQIVGAK
ncbi:MAG: 4-hydroxy-tetrahydrodipicolinate reductase [Bacteroidia bacterium]|nr:4-hydroxy-tetrahydrodipicolinate reductase [Bacteroidia bacterium]